MECCLNNLEIHFTFRRHVLSCALDRENIYVHIHVGVGKMTPEICSNVILKLFFSILHNPKQTSHNFCSVLGTSAGQRLLAIFSFYNHTLVSFVF